MIELSPEQKQAALEIDRWLAGSVQEFVVAGYAGTGNTTLAKLIAGNKSGVVFCAYTGKAANVLREKGCEPAGTIHGFLYSLSDREKAAIIELQEKLQEAISKGESKIVAEITALLEEKRKPKFSLNMESDLKYAKLVIVDEYSMLDEKIIADLRKVCKKILYLGDPYQLPPVSGKECAFKPDIFLTEIHRQALENPIIRASIDIREGRRLNYCATDQFTYAIKKHVAPEVFLNANQIIVGRNNTRQLWNKRFREIKGFAGAKFPMRGEKVICLKNNHVAGLYNGMIDIVVRDSVAFNGYFNLYLNEAPSAFIQVWNGDILNSQEQYDYTNQFHKSLERFDFAYAITCHKSQGSEFDNVLVYNEPIGKGEERVRWQYTAITRAKNKLTLVQPT